MSYSDEAIALQLQLGEDSRWEFKQVEFTGSRPRRPSHDDLADEIAAFASTGQVGQPFDIEAQESTTVIAESTDG
ncbi:MAG: hypothetical protein OXH85_00900 [Truepera sp.]|nr:hypothetical protein [Truepera sp.]